MTVLKSHNGYFVSPGILIHAFKYGNYGIPLGLSFLLGVSMTTGNEIKSRGIYSAGIAIYGNYRLTNFMIIQPSAQIALASSTSESSFKNNQAFGGGLSFFFSKPAFKDRRAFKFESMISVVDIGISDHFYVATVGVIVGYIFES